MESSEIEPKSWETVQLAPSNKFTIKRANKRVKSKAGKQEKPQELFGPTTKLLRLSTTKNDDDDKGASTVSEPMTLPLWCKTNRP